LLLSQRPGKLVPLGDWNCRVANSRLTTPHDNTRAPLWGESTANAQGKLLLELVARHDLHFINSRTPALTGPTCYKGSGESMVDHILVNGGEPGYMGPHAVTRCR
jgi:hypothetical protein